MNTYEKLLLVNKTQNVNIFFIISPIKIWFNNIMLFMKLKKKIQQRLNLFYNYSTRKYVLICLNIEYSNRAISIL